MKELSFTFTEEEANIILNALGEMSFKSSAPLIKKMQDQAVPQLVPSDEELPDKNQEATE